MNVFAYEWLFINGAYDRNITNGCQGKICIFSNL